MSTPTAREPAEGARAGYVEAIRAAVEGHRTARILLDTLREAAIAYDASVLTDPLWRDEMSAALVEIAATGLLRPSRELDRSGSPALPVLVTRLGTSRFQQAAPLRAYVDELASAAELALSRAERSLLDRVNGWLRDGGRDQEAIPLRERSYELFGDEKRLDSLAATRLFARGVVTFELLRAFPTPPPLAVRQVGTAPWVLVVENSATFASVRAVLTELAACPGGNAAVGDVAYGAGKLAPYAMPSLVDERSSRGHAQYEALLYFGDLDAPGIAIAAGCAAAAAAAGLSEVVPARALYRALLLRPAAAAPAGSGALAPSAVEWFGSELAGDVAVLLAGHVLRQEALPRPDLRRALAAVWSASSSTPDWTELVTRLAERRPTPD